jgi:SOS response associated peptidase (SRAP)
VRNSAVTSCAIITTAANELVGPLHDRMPAILPAESYDAWLEPNTHRATLKKLLSPFPASQMKSHPVSSAVNHPENDNDQLITRIDVEVGTTPSCFRFEIMQRVHVSCPSSFQKIDYRPNVRAVFGRSTRNGDFCLVCAHLRELCLTSLDNAERGCFERAFQGFAPVSSRTDSDTLCERVVRDFSFVGPLSRRRKSHTKYFIPLTLLVVVRRITPVFMNVDDASTVSAINVIPLGHRCYDHPLSWDHHWRSNKNYIFLRDLAIIR